MREWPSETVGPYDDEEVYVAWLRWTGDENHRHLIVCDSDDERAFKVYRRPTSPASHAAESAPLLPSDTLHICTACWAGNHGSCSGGKCGCVHESASVAQLDAEDQHRAAEPVEEAVKP